MNSPNMASTSGADSQTATAPKISDHLKELDDVKSEITACMEAASKCLTDLGKDKISTKGFDSNANAFRDKVRKIEKVLSQQMNYLHQIGIGTPHEGTAHGAIQSYFQSQERLDYIHKKLADRFREISQPNELAHQSVSNINEANSLGASNKSAKVNIKQTPSDSMEID